MEGFAYRLARREESLGGLKLSVECLASLDQTIDDLFEFLQRTGQEGRLDELCPYFGMIWPSARGLAEAMGMRGADAFREKRVLEIGCGLAVPSLLAAKMGAEVTVTDFHPAVPEFLERNLKLNGLAPLRYLALDWLASPLPDERFDWVIGSDILYESKHPASVAQVVARHLAPHGTALIADPARPYLQNFVDEMTRRGFRHETDVRKVSWDRPDDSKEVFVLTLRPPVANSSAEPR